jgi:hypothetical protein
MQLESFKIDGEVFFVEPDFAALADTRRRAIEAFDAIVLACISDSDGDRWRALRAREVDPVSMSEVAGIVGWLGDRQP